MSARHGCGFLLCLLLHLLQALPLQSQSPAEVAEHDADSNQKLSQGEVAKLMYALDPGCVGKTDVAERTKCADDSALDFFSSLSPYTETPQEIAISDALPRVRLYFRERAALEAASVRAELEKASPKSQGWTITRAIADKASLSKWQEDRPFVFSLKRDNLAEEAKNRDAYTMLGSVGYKFAPKVDENDPFHLTQFALGVDVDADGAKSAAESSVVFSAPVEWSWTYKSPRFGLDGFALKIAPKFETDRHWDREVYGLLATLNIARESAAIGYKVWSSTWLAAKPPLLSFQWNPSLTLQGLLVEDAGGSATLAALEGEAPQLRGVPRVEFWVGFPRTADRLLLNLDYRMTWDERSSKGYGYGEGSLSYKASRFVDLTVIYRRGFKGDALEKTDQVLAGVGIQISR